MDPTRFDALTRVLTNTIGRAAPRRGVLGALAALFAADRAAAKSDAERSNKDRKDNGKGKGKGKGRGKGKECKGGQKKCNNVCTDTGADFFNCGTCGNVCSSEAGSVCCGGECINTGRDLRHCGGCGRPCDGLDAACIDGLCTVCPVNQERCPDGTCADLQTDAKNCGACGSACPSGETCQSGRCACAGPRCPLPGGGTRCCPATAGVCCDGGGCCRNGQTCQPGGQCCDGGYYLCPDGAQCCPNGYACGGNCGRPCCFFG